MHDITPDAVVIGVDTHQDVHVAVAINGLGADCCAASRRIRSAKLIRACRCARRRALCFPNGSACSVTRGDAHRWGHLMDQCAIFQSVLPPLLRTSVISASNFHSSVALQPRHVTRTCASTRWRSWRDLGGPTMSTE